MNAMRLRLALLVVLFGMVLSAQEGVQELKVKVIPLDDSISCGAEEATVPVPSPELMMRIADRMRGPVPIPSSPFQPGSEGQDVSDPGKRVIWSVRAIIQPSFSEDADFTFLEFEDHHRELVFARPLLLNCWGQLYGNRGLLQGGLEPAAVADHLLHARWVFDSRKVPEIASMMDGVRNLKKGLGYNSPAMGLDGTDYTFEFYAGDGILKVRQWEREGANNEVVDWAEKCLEWLQAKVKATWEPDLKAALARMDKREIGPRALASAMHAGLSREIVWILDSGVLPDCRDERDEEGQTALINAVSGRNFEALRILLERGAHPDLQDGCGRTALHHLALRRNYSRLGEDQDREQELDSRMLKALLAAGAKTDIKDQKGQTALALAVARGNMDMVKLLSH